MKNKLLLASIASITLASVANATDYTVNFISPNNININGQNFNSVQSIFDYMETNDFDEFNDNLFFDRTQPELIKAVINNNPAFTRDIIQLITQLEDLELSPEEITEISSTINTFGAIFSNQTPEEFNQIISLIDLNRILNEDEDGFEQVKQYIDGLDLDENEAARLAEFKQKFNSFVEKIEVESEYREINGNVSNIIKTSNLDEDNKDILNQYINLIKKANRENNSNEATLSSLAALEEFVKTIDFAPVRNSAQTQEYLKNIQKITEDDNVDEAREAVAVLKKLQDTVFKNDGKATDLPPVQQSDSAITEALVNSLMIAAEIVNTRVNNFSAVAAGDLLDTKGIWVQGSYSKGEQKAYGNATGYKLTQKGMTIGADVGDENILGLAYSYNMNDINDKIANQNKTDLTSHIATMYGKFNISNEVFTRGQASFGKSHIKRKRNTGDLANNIAKGKTNSTILSGKIEVGYDAALNTSLHLIPTVGLSYVNVDIKGYKESGLGLNRTVGKRTSNKTSGLAGISAAYNIEVNSDTKLLPEIHANLDYAFKTKNSATLVTVIKGIDPIATPAEKLAKTYYNVGGSIKSINDNFEIAVGYDLGLSKKFQSHTGALKLRVNM
ncbi:MAG: autotransporter domain-containing protein [Rickettsiales bacterium]|nr:MAG: autotransporter domain-containing protein [Rickettsiales bacterium]